MIKSREIQEAINALENETHRDAAINQLILSGNSSPEKLNYLLTRMIENIQLSSSFSSAVPFPTTPSLAPSQTSQTSPSQSPASPQSPTSSKSEPPSSPSSKKRIVEAFELSMDRILLGLIKTHENISIILTKDLILEKLIHDMTTTVTSLTILSSLSKHENQGATKLIQFPIILSKIIQNLYNPIQDYYQPSFLLLHNLLELNTTRELIQSMKEFQNVSLYHKFCELQNLLPMNVLCSVLMQISRTSNSHSAMYSADGILSFLLNIMNTTHYPYVKSCLICLMNLSSEITNRSSMLGNKILFSSVIFMARQHKGKLRQCCLGILLNLSFAAINDSQIGFYLMKFPQYLDVILLSIRASGEITTQCYGMGIVSNLTTCLENKYQFIQLSFAKSLLQCIQNILSINEPITPPIHSTSFPSSSSSSLSSPHNSKYLTNFWLLKSDCCQVLANLSNIPHSIPSMSLSPSSPSPSPSSSSEQMTIINEWKTYFCSQENLLLICLFTATGCQIPSTHSSQIRTHCLKTIDQLIPTLSSPFHSSSSSHSMESRHLFNKIRNTLNEYSLPSSNSSIADKVIMAEILVKIETILEDLDLIESEAKVVSPRITSTSKSKKQRSNVSRKQHKSDSITTVDDKLTHVAEGKPNHLSSSSSPSKKSSLKSSKRTFS